MPSHTANTDATKDVVIYGLYFYGCDATVEFRRVGRFELNQRQS